MIVNNKEILFSCCSISVLIALLMEISIFTLIEMRKNGDLKTILLWTNSQSWDLYNMRTGHQIFLQQNCPISNCYITHNKHLLDDYTKFDIVLFEARTLMETDHFPRLRSPHQKYVFFSREPADYYPICDRRFDGYFNVTWTYKLDSDLQFGYIAIRDADLNVIGPNNVMNWLKPEDMDKVSNKLRRKLRLKSKAVAWVVSRCKTRSKREDFVREMQYELQKYGLSVDVYGDCGRFKCSKLRQGKCLEKLGAQYYFYLSFENSFCDDYVSEKLLHSIKFGMVPIVFGGANYTRFMPDGMYLNARTLGPHKLAEAIHNAIQDPEMYYQFFRWKSHYSYHPRHENPETDNFCSLCSYLNAEGVIEKAKVYYYEDMRSWWNPPGRCIENAGPSAHRRDEAATGRIPAGDERHEMDSTILE